MHTPNATLGKGNIKVGKVPTFSLPSRITCPGASTWCLAHCYAYRFERRLPNCRIAYSENLVLSWDEEEFVEEILHGLERHAKCMRIHVSGDFYSAHYTNAWIRICQTRPRTQFWSYTRSWTIPTILPLLEQLRDMPNVQLFASVDPTMPIPPPGWRKAFISTDDRATGIQCPEQQQKTESCLACGYCFRAKAGDVMFRVH